jgi:hypothetical protein
VQAEIVIGDKGRSRHGRAGCSIGG